VGFAGEAHEGGSDSAGLSADVSGGDGAGGVEVAGLAAGDAVAEVALHLGVCGVA
jgi:hypothetical protein